MTIYCVAGANGCGKSTLVQNMLNGSLLNGKCKGLPYICPDMEALALSHIADIRARYRAAMDRCEAMRSALIRRGTDFIMETVLSRADKLDELENAKSTRRCRLFSVYVGTDSPEVNVARVARRVAQGGHDVPPDKVAERYYRSMQNLGPLIELSDDMLIYDNSGAEYELLLRRRRANFTVYENAHGWFARYALPCLPE